MFLKPFDIFAYKNKVGVLIKALWVARTVSSAITLV